VHWNPRNIGNFVCAAALDGMGHDLTAHVCHLQR